MMESLRILLVDGNRHGQVARRAALEDLGYTVESASLAQEALTRFEENRFDVVVTDFRLSDFGGPELIARLREKSPRTHSIILSGYVSALGLTEVSTGADALVTKGPNELKQLTRAIAQVARPRAKSTIAERSVRRAPAARRSGRRA